MLIIAGASSILSEPTRAKSPAPQALISQAETIYKSEDVMPDSIATPAIAAEPAIIEPGGRTKREIRCLARAIYFEARGEPLSGQIAVAEVIIARSEDRRWHTNLCDIIRMPYQFSFVRNGVIPRIKDAAAAQSMMDLARDVVSGEAISPARGSLYFHATSVSPSWRHALKKSAKIQNHIFYMDRSTI